MPHRVWHHFAYTFHDLEVRDRFSTFWLACSIPSALTFDAFGVSHTGFLTAPISFSRVLSVGLNPSRAITYLTSTLFTDMAENAASDSKRFKTAFTCCGSVAFVKRDDPSLSCLHPRACLPEVCAHDPFVTPLRDLD